MNPSDRVAVVILNWNKAELTRRCVEIAQESTALPVHWIVVDNASQEPLGEMPPNVTVIRNEVNKGFAGGVNVGLKHAFEHGADYAWLLNNDAETFPQALEHLVAAMQADPQIGLASSLILNSDENDEIEFYGGYTEMGTSLVTKSAEQYALWRRECPERIWLLGTALLIRRALVEKIGYFDDGLFAYHEDNDISRRTAAAGFRSVVIAESKVRHPSGKHGEVMPRPPYYYYYMVRNDLLVLRKLRDPARAWYWSLRRHWRWYRSPEVPAACRKAIRLGIVHGLLGRTGPMTAKF